MKKKGNKLFKDYYWEKKRNEYKIKKALKSDIYPFEWNVLVFRFNQATNAACKMCLNVVSLDVVDIFPGSKWAEQ